MSNLFAKLLLLLSLTGCSSLREVRTEHPEEVVGKGLLIFRIARTGQPTGPHDCNQLYILSDIHRFGDAVDIQRLYFNPVSPGWYYCLMEVRLDRIIAGTPVHSYRETNMPLPEPRKENGNLMFDVPDFGTVSIKDRSR